VILAINLACPGRTPKTPSEPGRLTIFASPSNIVSDGIVIFTNIVLFIEQKF
jgi:hypothetical protein